MYRSEYALLWNGRPRGLPSSRRDQCEAQQQRVLQCGLQREAQGTVPTDSALWRTKYPRQPFFCQHYITFT